MSPPISRISITRLWPTAHPNCWRVWANSVFRACASASSDSSPENTPTRRAGFACCAFNATGQATALPRIPRNSRRLMKAPAHGKAVLPAYTNTLEGAQECLLVRCRAMSALGQKQTYAAQKAMSAKGQKQTCAVQLGMSALGHKRTHAAQQKGSLFDDLIGGDQQARWNCQ